ncbi:lipopolysaccharide assembly protein LapB [Streptomyces sp. ISL-100]|uniref:tetratricopeptide repeat protein n=1 Tax=Streptomyces sp. ISL-100 TaxID=2819173 RepID=UPI001BE5BAF5|nr:tetratricopeptide repeat protein [Streptomyces sp. ISL-100]MBT2398216.1 tetratricopeptide repeat protein [Streptomyces sp. ISL-100]
MLVRKPQPQSVWSRERWHARWHGPRRWRIAVVVAVAAGLTATSVAMGADGDPDRTGRDTPAPAADVSVERLTAGDLAQGIDALHKHLQRQPKDATGWATLGTAYVEQARTSGDPTRYPQAEKAFERSLKLRPPGENDAALAGRAALAAARHDFGAALGQADRALRVNPYSERALSSRVDALVELGRYDEALRAAELADRRRPGIPVFTRYAYVLELHGDAKRARQVLLRALESAFTPADVAYVATSLGQLAWSQGQYGRAQGHFTTAVRADPKYVPALEGRGRTYAAQGQTKRALRDLEEVVRRYPLPGQLAALGELQEAAGQPERAEEQHALIGTWTRLARANGVATDLESALIEADHGDAEEALKSARAEWSRRKSVHTADALAWALHANGKDQEALTYAKKATAERPGYRNASFLFHRGMIEHALGDDKAARRSLRAALDLNRGFSLTGAREAKSVLSGKSALSGPRGES